jgi:5-bromo-4-chloroindolyl phosphate hydrolysis protein
MKLIIALLGYPLAIFCIVLMFIAIVSLIPLSLVMGLMQKMERQTK